MNKTLAKTLTIIFVIGTVLVTLIKSQSGPSADAYRRETEMLVSQRLNGLDYAVMSGGNVYIAISEVQASIDEARAARRPEAKERAELMETELIRWTAARKAQTGGWLQGQ